MKSLLVLTLCLLSLWSVAQVRIDANSKADLMLISKSYAVEKKVDFALKEMYPINKINNIEYVSFLGKVNQNFSEEELKAIDAIRGSRVANIVSFRVPIDRLDEINNLTGFEYIQLASKIKPELNKVHWDVNIDSVWQGIGLSQGYTGKNVIIGITDWGFDYSHPMFYDTSLLQTRILAAWDQFKTSGPAPVGYNYGTEYSSQAEFIAAGADTANIYSYATHGSHVAGIAGGSGAGTPYRGMAFEANYLFTTFLVDESAVLDACQWMYEKAEAENKRLVVNMSWGLYYMGSNDGTSLLSQGLDAYSDLDVVFVTSAGNNGDVNFHLKHDFSGDTIQTRVNFYNSAMTTFYGQSIHAWGEAGNDFELGIVVYDGSYNLLAQTDLYTTNTISGYIDTFLVVGSDTVWYNLSGDQAYPTNGRPQMRLRIKKPAVSYRFGIRSTAQQGRMHYWNVTELTSDVGNWGMPFSTVIPGSETGDNEYGIGAPACTQSVISVAAHVPKYPSGSNWIGGSQTAFSSLGPLMNEVMKPDISAPGSSIASSISSYTDNSYSPIDIVNWNGRDYPFARFSGTSMSSPCVAGIVAVMLEANPYLSPEQVKSIIQQTAYQDNYTGVIPPEGSTKWGMGKIDAYAAIMLALNTISVHVNEEPISWLIAPNPASQLIDLLNVSGEYDDIKIIDLQGKVVLESEQELTLNIRTLDRGTYIVRMVRNNRVEQQKFVKE